MTPAQTAKLEQLDAAIAQEPDAWWHLHRRAHFLSEVGGDFGLVAADIGRALLLEWSDRQGFGRQKRGHCRQFRSFLINRGRDAWQVYRPKVEAGTDDWLKLFHKARAVAAFELALENTPDLAAWRAARTENWDALEALEFAGGVDWKNPPLAWEGASIEEWKARAVALAIARDDIQACCAYACAVEGGAAAETPATPPHQCARRARNRELENYQQLLWWCLAVMRAPGEPRWSIARGRWMQEHGHLGAARGDFEAAIALCPDDPRLYEARAKALTKRRWWNMEWGAAGDYARAIRLRVAAGEFSGAPEALAAQGDKQWPAIDKGGKRKRPKVRACAFYSLAIEAKPDVADWYLARARAIEAPLWKFYPPDEAWAQAAYPDYLRALALDRTLASAQAAVTKHLSKTLSKGCGHERLEGLLNERQTMLDFGVDAGLVAELIGEVERALAA